MALRASNIDESILYEFEARQAAALEGAEVAKLEASECVKFILQVTATNPATILTDGVDEIDTRSRHVSLLLH